MSDVMEGNFLRQSMQKRILRREEEDKISRISRFQHDIILKNKMNVKAMSNIQGDRKTRNIMEETANVNSTAQRRLKWENMNIYASSKKIDMQNIRKSLKLLELERNQKEQHLKQKTHQKMATTQTLQQSASLDNKSDDLNSTLNLMKANADKLNKV